MRISFDIDETLVCRHPNAPVEKSSFPAFLHGWLGEPLRLGTRSLVRDLREQGWSIWIYTSSLRSLFHIRLWLLLHGIRVDGIVNDERHRRALEDRTFERLPSKFPPAFNIDLHVDDSEGVRMEGKQHGFEVIVVHPEDPSWTQHILNSARKTKHLVLTGDREKGSLQPVDKSRE